MQQNVTWFLSASATRTPSSYHVVFLHKYIYIGLHIEYPTSSVCLGPRTPYVQAVAPTRSGAIKDPVPKLAGPAFSPHPKFPPSPSDTVAVSVMATKHFVAGHQDRRSAHLLLPEPGAKPGCRSAGCRGQARAAAGRSVSGCCWSGSLVSLLSPLYWHFFCL